MRVVWLGCVAAALYGQAELKGRYQFVRLTVKTDASSMGGTVTFDGSGGFQVATRQGKGAGSYKVTGPGRVTLTSAALGPLELLFSEDWSAMTGPLGGDGHDFLAGVRAPEGTATAGLVEGNYAGGYLGLKNGEARGLASAYVEFSANGRGALEDASLSGHVGNLDDVNRKEAGKGWGYTIRNDGSGTLRLGEKSDLIQGPREILVSANGDYVLGFGTGAAERDVMVLVRKPKEAATFTLSGSYWMAEMSAENTWTFKPEAARLSSGAGLIRMDGNGNAMVSQRLRQGGRTMRLTTSNVYRISFDASGGMSGKLNQGLKNLAVGMNPSSFAGAQVGSEGKLTLEHGIFFAIRAPAVEGWFSLQAPAAAHDDRSPVSAEKPARPGEKLLLLVPGLGKTDSVKVMFDGKSAVAVSAGVDQISVTVPSDLTAGAIGVAVATADAVSDLLEIVVAR